MPDRFLPIIVILGAAAVTAVVAYEVWRKRNDPRGRRDGGGSGVEGSFSGDRNRDGADDGGGDGGGGGD
jgi:hypothetical protein